MSIEAIATERRPAGRPKGAGRLPYRFAIAASATYRTWMGEFLAHLGGCQAAEAFRRGLRLLAESEGFRPPPAY